VIPDLWLVSLPLSALQIDSDSVERGETVSHEKVESIAILQWLLDDQSKRAVFLTMNSAYLYSRLRGIYVDTPSCRVPFPDGGMLEGIAALHS
jgi:hypothetical protein